MMVRKLVVNLSASALLLSSGAFALPLDHYNLILIDDYNFQGGDVEGKTLIGGDLLASGYGAVFGSRAVRFEDTLEVVGDITATNITVENGDVVYGGTANVDNFNMNGGGSVSHDPNLSISSVQSELLRASHDYSLLNANGTYASNQKTLSYNGTDSTAVFNVSADNLFAQNTSLRLNSGSAETVVINVSGVNITAGGGTNLVDGFRHSDIGAGNILWNFYEAQTIDFNNLGMFGSVLATNADITGGAVFDGAVAANSYTGGREFHNFLFNPPSVNVDEPGTMGMIALGLLALFVTSRKRKLK